MAELLKHIYGHGHIKISKNGQSYEFPAQTMAIIPTEERQEYQNQQTGKISQKVKGVRFSFEGNIVYHKSSQKQAVTALLNWLYAVDAYGFKIPFDLTPKFKAQGGCNLTFAVLLQEININQVSKLESGQIIELKLISQNLYPNANILTNSAAYYNAGGYNTQLYNK